MNPNIDLNPGEIKLTFNEPTTGRTTFKELGLVPESVDLQSGMLRLVFDFDNIPNADWFKVPTIEVSYQEEVTETHWQCDFNGETILDKYDHHGHATVLLLNKKRIQDLMQRHENKLIVHAEFPQSVHLDCEGSFVNLFK